MLAQDGCDGFEDTGDGLVFEKQIAYVDDFYKASEDLEFSITEPLIDHWVCIQNKMKEAGMKVPMPSRHTEEAGFKKAEVLSLSKRNDSQGRVGLFSKLKFDDSKAADDYKSSGVSIYVKSDVTVPTTKELLTYPITHVAFTDYPVLPGMDEFVKIAASMEAEPVFTKDSFEKKGDEMDHVLKLADTLDIEVSDKEDATEKITTKFKELSDQIVSLSDEIKDLKKDPPKKIEELPIISASMFNLDKENRDSKVENLLRDNFINPAQAKKLQEKYITKEVIACDFNSEQDSDFNRVCEILRLGSKHNLLGEEETGIQDAELILSQNDVNDPKKNSLLATIERRYANSK